MAATDSRPRPGLRFIWLTIITALLTAAIAAGALWSNATWAPKLALDLEGGTSIILEPQVKDQQVTKEQLQQAVAIIRQRVDSTGVSEAEINTQGDRNIIVNLPGNPDEQTRELVRSSAQLAFRRVAAVGAPGVEGQDGASSPASTGPSLSKEDQKKLDELTKQDGQTPNAGGSVTPRAQAAAASTGQASPSASASAPQQGQQGTGDDAKRPVFDPEKDQSWATAEILKQYQSLDCTNPKNRTGGAAGPADKPIVACSSDGDAKYVLGPVEISGDHVSDASFGYQTSSTGNQTNEPAVNMEFDPTGTEQFKQITTEITNKQQPYNQFAIVLDGLVLSAPVSQAQINDGHAQITGNFTEQSAQTLASQLKNGALPISFQVQSEEQISPTLGSDYLQKGLLAGAIGLGLVVLYSLLQYRVLGLVTVSSLVVAGVLTYLLLLFVSWRYGYRLSLAGVAGIIVGIGMTADSFIVYFERVRDELREGRRLLSAVEVGWDRAKKTIYASKAVNMLAAVILYVLAVGSVRGFAFTLGLTVIVDVLVVVLFTHPMLQALARTRFFGEGHPMSGMDPRQLGVSQAAYRGALNLDLDAARASSKSGGSYREAKKRQAAADRRSGESAGSTTALKDRGATSAPAEPAERTAAPAERASAQQPRQKERGKPKKRDRAGGASGAGLSLAERKAQRQAGADDDGLLADDEGKDS
ncbi:protein translocase subunit SecD [Brevibacterium sp. BRM-1]|uniref:protein translocase subunit SecD n=1 Tax=Brevibacterium sp. BRM-1 TaxID=2999062 RepID=UPI00227DA178|nr:protein translocase subunit SecD [Brevibacterium sp. BRM-1]WAL40930.1 protein translocase subunit SecD [Brevibacterium sp. BRM-1]